MTYNSQANIPDDDHYESMLKSGNDLNASGMMLTSEIPIDPHFQSQ